IVLCGKHKYKNYLILALLGLIAFFLRPANGIFFIAFIGAFLLDSKHSSNRLILVSGIILLVFAISIFGFEFFFQKYSTLRQVRIARTLSQTGPGSLGAKLITLPFPLHYISRFCFSQINPFPFWHPLTVF